MKNLIISKNEEGQRLDKLLTKYLDKAPKSFIYKMLRKKNITLNGKKALGSEILAYGDEVKLFFAEETLEKFHTNPVITQKKHGARMPGTPDGKKKSLLPQALIYEDEDLLLINKPAGILSQGDGSGAPALTDALLEYLLTSGSLTLSQLETFRPAVCNRLDRNTSGIVIAGKSLPALQEMSRLLHDRTVHKYYRCLAAGQIQEDCHLKGFLIKDTKTNQVRILDQPDPGQEALPIETSYRVIEHLTDCTLLEVLLITGRSHQIRAHLASVGHPILGDPKYGDPRINEYYRRTFGVRTQLLHSYRLEYPQLQGHFSYLSGQQFTAPLPEIYQRILRTKTSRIKPGT